MRIGVITTSFPRWPDDHAGRFVLTLGLALVERGHEVEVVAPHPGSGAPPRWPGVDVVWAGARGWPRLAYGAGIPENVAANPLAAAAAPALAAALAAAALRRRGRWDAVLTHWLVPAGLAGALIRGARPHVAVAHSADLWLLRRAGPLGARLARQVARSARGVVAVSPEHGAAVAALASSEARIHVVPMPAERLAPADDAARRRVADVVRAGRGAALRALFVGRLVPVKGVDVAIEGVARPEAAGVALAVAGDGPQRPRLAALAAARGARVDFLGAVSPALRRAALAACDVAVVPSVTLPGGRTEGAPVAALEALAAGVPVVASDVGGLRWLVGDAGIVVEPGSPAALASALARLRDDALLRSRLSRAALARARRFSPAAAARTVECLLVRGDPT